MIIYTDKTDFMDWRDKLEYELFKDRTVWTEIMRFISSPISYIRGQYLYHTRYGLDKKSREKGVVIKGNFTGEGEKNS